MWSDSSESSLEVVGAVSYDEEGNRTEIYLNGPARYTSTPRAQRRSARERRRQRAQAQAAANMDSSADFSAVHSGAPVNDYSEPAPPTRRQGSPAQPRRSTSAYAANSREIDRRYNLFLEGIQQLPSREQRQRRDRTPSPHEFTSRNVGETLQSHRNRWCRNAILAMRRFQTWVYNQIFRHDDEIRDNRRLITRMARRIIDLQVARQNDRAAVQEAQQAAREAAESAARVTALAAEMTQRNELPIPPRASSSIFGPPPRPPRSDLNERPSNSHEAHYSAWPVLELPGEESNDRIAPIP